MVWVTTRGGPIGASSTMATYLYEQFRKSLFGYASAVSIVIFALLPRDRPLLPAPRHATRPPRDWSRCVSRRTLTRLGLYLVALVVLAVVIIPLTFSVLGGFRTSLQLGGGPGRPAGPVGLGELPLDPHRPGRSGARSATARSSPCSPLASCYRPRRWPPTSSPATPSRVASWCTGCSRSGCCSRLPSPSCRCSSCSARSDCSAIRSGSPCRRRRSGCRSPSS